tara:strand:+ start:282 stop:779 length:498 start_codon:yes stop_codon:yes gene_type:complete
MKIFGVVGWKNSGKTGLIERLLVEISCRGLSVSTIKHAHHNFDLDQEGTDSYRHRQAGAKEVVLSSKKRWAVISELRGSAEPSLEYLIEKISPVDLILIEGFKTSGHEKIETYRSETLEPLLLTQDKTIVALASDNQNCECRVPKFNLDDTYSIANFILNRVDLL